jgi:hypothetical protein
MTTVKQHQAKITALVTKVGGSINDKANKPDKRSDRANSNRTGLHKCKIYHQMVKHKDKNNLELEENVQKWFEGWTPHL